MSHRPAATFVLSLDVELAWGVHDRIDPATVPFEQVEEIIAALLELFDRHEVPVTWALVGHLLLDGCDRGAGGLAHPEMPRPRHRWLEGDWYRHDPCGPADRHPAWYQPRLAQLILAAAVPHDIGCHGFSHVIIGDAGCDAETARAEMQAAAAAVESATGVRPTSFVFPRNSIGHLSTLRDARFRIYRELDRSWMERAPVPEAVRKLLRILDLFLPIVPPAVEPSEVLPGLWSVPGSMLLTRAEGFRRLIPAALRSNKAIGGIERAIRTGRIFHLWFHPWNLLDRGEIVLKALDAILKHAARRAEEGKLRLATMADLIPREEGTGSTSAGAQR